MNDSKPTTTESTTNTAPRAPVPRAPGILRLAIYALLIALLFWAGSQWGGPVGEGVSGLWSAVTGGDDDSSSEDEESGFYTCGMHPWVILPSEGLCPICFMDLTPLDPSKFTGEVRIDPVIVQNMGVRVAPVTRGPLVKTIRTVGTIDEVADGALDEAEETLGKLMGVSNWFKPGGGGALAPSSTP